MIDGENGRLQNVIMLEPDAIFAVDSTLDVVSPQRVEFKFTRAFYRQGDQKPFNLPPFGQGW